MTTDLSAISSVQQNFFVEVDIVGQGFLRFSDYATEYTIDSESYDSLGSLLGLTTTKTEIRATSSTLTITISGIPIANLNMANNINFLGSPVTVRQALFDPTTGNILSTTQTNPVIKFKGFVNKFAIKEDWNTDQRLSRFAIVLQVKSIIGQLLTKTAGRRTNPVDQNKFFPSDTSFSRVPTLRNSNYNFGAPDIVPRVGTK